MSPLTDMPTTTTLTLPSFSLASHANDDPLTGATTFENTSPIHSPLAPIPATNPTSILDDTPDPTANDLCISDTNLIPEHPNTPPTSSSWLGLETLPPPKQPSRRTRHRPSPSLSSLRALHPSSGIHRRATSSRPSSTRASRTTNTLFQNATHYYPHHPQQDHHHHPSLYFPHLPGTRRRLSKERRKTVRWTDDEVMELINGVDEYGFGKWATILRQGRCFNVCRTSVDLKDKWRNLTAVRGDNMPALIRIEEGKWLVTLNNEKRVVGTGRVGGGGGGSGGKGKAKGWRAVEPVLSPVTPPPMEELDLDLGNLVGSEGELQSAHVRQVLRDMKKEHDEAFGMEEDEELLKGNEAAGTTSGATTDTTATSGRAETTVTLLDECMSLQERQWQQQPRHYHDQDDDENDNHVGVRIKEEDILDVGSTNASELKLSDLHNDDALKLQDIGHNTKNEEQLGVKLQTVSAGFDVVGTAGIGNSEIGPVFQPICF